MPMSEQSGLLVLGLGNVLCGDDGLGVAAVALLNRRYAAPPGVDVLDGGTLGLSLLSHLTRARSAILVDAVRTGASPGSVVRLEGTMVMPTVLERLSPHQVGVADLMLAAQLIERAPEHLVLLGLVPDSLDFGLGLSPAVATRLPGLVERIADEARALGYEFDPHEDAACRSGGDVARLYGL
jgi:hydrogenase maturation protease